MEKKEFESTSITNQMINEDRERYMVYKTNKENGIFVPQGESIYLLELLDVLGFPMDKPGTYFFRELVSDICGDIESCDCKLSDYKTAIVLKDLSSEKPILFSVISDRLGIRPEGFNEYVYDAISNIDNNHADKTLSEVVLGSSKNQSNSIMAYNIAKYYEYAKAIGAKQPIKKRLGLVKEIKKKSESI